MTGEIKIAYAERDGQLLHISQVEGGLSCNCVCPVCKTQAIARKGERKRPHFAHYPGTNCSAETVLHEVAKRLIHERLTNALSKSTEMPVEWTCLYCREVHRQNIEEKSSGAALEESFGECRPDVVLIDGQGKPIHFLEVVVSHEPDEQVVSYCKDNGIGLVKFKVKTAADLERIQLDEVWHPTSVAFCLRPYCPKCKHPLRVKTMYVVDGNCWKCKSGMRVAMISLEGMASGPEHFSEEDIAIARSHGAVLESNFSHAVNESYMSNSCRTCRTFIGSFYLHDYSHLMIPSNAIPRGYGCMRCDLHYG